MRRSDARPTGKLRLSSLLLFLAFTTHVHANDPSSPYKIDWTRDVSVTAMAALGWVAPELMRDQLVDRSCPCNARGLNALDRPVAGVQHAAPALAADLGIVSVYTLSFALDALDVTVSHERVTGWLADALVIAQTLAVNGALNSLAKIAFARPRPLVYGRAANDPVVADGANYVSFYSEHTSGAFAAGLAFAQTFAFRHPDSPIRFVAYAIAIAAGSAVGALRMASGKHFPTDVLVGAAVGSMVGWAVPWLHTRHPTVQLSIFGVETGAGLALSYSHR